MRDIFDLPALTALLGRIAERRGSCHHRRFASALRPLPPRCSSATSPTTSTTAMRRWPSAARRPSSIDQSQLQELLGDADYRELLDPAVLHEVEEPVAAARPQPGCAPCRRPSMICCCASAISARKSCACAAKARRPSLASTLCCKPGACSRSALPEEPRYVAVEYAAQYRDALGVRLPAGSARHLALAHPAPLSELLKPLRAHPRSFHARRSFTAAIAFQSPPDLKSALADLTRKGRLLEGEFRPGGCIASGCIPRSCSSSGARHPGPFAARGRPARSRVVLGSLSAALAGCGKQSARRQIEARAQRCAARRAARYHRNPARPGAAALRVGARDSARAHARLRSRRARHLMAAGEVVWVGRGTLGEHDGRLALYLAESLPALLPPPGASTLAAAGGPRAARSRSFWPATAHRFLPPFIRLPAEDFPAKPATPSGSLPGKAW